MTDPSADHHPATPVDTSKPPFEAVALLAILALALALRGWELERNGWGAEYYSAAVRSMAMNWHNFFFVAFDPAGFISVDKPPVSLWLQVLSVKLFGFNPLSLLLPQVLEGVAAVWVLYRLVRQQFSAMSALLAALFLATTPVWVAVNRTNNTDSCLLLVLLLAAWALLKAAETGNRRMLFLSMALVGLAFNVKMLAAFVVLPGFYLTYLLGLPQQWRRRVLDLALASLVLAACALPWVIAYEATPAEDRPYVGGSRQNSMLELVVGHNALSRFVARTKTPAEAASSLSAGTETQAAAESRVEARSRARSEFSRLFVQTPAGPSRLVGGLLGAQVEWLLPLALIALIMAATHFNWRRPPGPQPLAMLFWLCWSISYAAVFSALGGIIHFYYLATLAPALAALAGIGVADLWQRNRERERFAVLLPLSLLVCAAWQLQLQVSALNWNYADIAEPADKWLGWLHLAVGGGSLVAAATLIAASLKGAKNEAAPAFGASALAVGMAALLTLPVTWSLAAVLAPANGILPSADLQRLITAVRNAEWGAQNRYGQFIDTSRLIGFLQINRGAEDFLLATSTTQLAANVIIASGEPVLVRGGFQGLDPAINVDKLARMANEKQIRFVMLGDLSIVSRRMGAEAAGKPVSDWVRSNGKLVDPIFWRTGRSRSAVELYDLHPEIELLPVPATGNVTLQEQ